MGSRIAVIKIKSLSFLRMRYGFLCRPAGNLVNILSYEDRWQPLGRTLGGPRSRSARGSEENNICPRPEANHDYPASWYNGICQCWALLGEPSGTDRVSTIMQELATYFCIEITPAHAQECITLILKISKHVLP
jgi:hypothetical protein